MGNVNTLEEILEIATAANAGKPIEWQRPSDGTWSANSCGGFNFAAFKYRIKPEPQKPRVIYVWQFADGTLSTRNWLEGKTHGVDLGIGEWIKFTEDMESREGCGSDASEQ